MRNQVMPSLQTFSRQLLQPLFLAIRRSLFVIHATMFEEAGRRLHRKGDYPHHEDLSLCHRQVVISRIGILEPHLGSWRTIQDMAPS